MLALTICQPYAELILRGEKRVENRTWWPPRAVIGQRVAIHVGKSRAWLRGAPDTGLVFGALVGSARLVGVWSLREIERGWCEDEFRGQPPEWLRDHEHTEGPVCWVLGEVERLSRPVPMRGALGLWTVRETLREVDRLQTAAVETAMRARWLF